MKLVTEHGELDVFPLQGVLIGCAHYYMARDQKIYSDKSKGPAKWLKGSLVNGVRYYTLNTLKYKEGYIAYKIVMHHQHDFLRQTEQRNSQMKVTEMKTASLNDVVEGVKRKGTIIGSIVNGKLVLGTNPKFHYTDSTVKAELARLATVAPGTTFVALKVTSSVVAAGLVWA